MSVSSIIILLILQQLQAPSTDVDDDDVDWCCFLCDCGRDSSLCHTSTNMSSPNNSQCREMFWLPETFVSNARGRSSRNVPGLVAITFFDTPLEHSQGHDEGMLQVMDVLMGLTGMDHEKTTAHQLPTPPIRLGGLGLRRASHMAPAAFWSSWAADDPSEVARRRTHHNGEFGWTARGWRLSGRIARRDNSIGPARFHRPPKLGRVEAVALLQQISWSLVDGHMAGSSMRLPFLNITSGRP